MHIESMFSKQQVDGMYARLKEVADGLGIPIRRQPHAPNTKKALALSEYARRRDKLAAWREAAMNAYWRDGKDLEDETVLRELLTEAGLEADEALAFLADPEVPQILLHQRIEAQRWGVTGIPTWYLLPDGWEPEHGIPESGPRPVRVVGCQPLEVVEQAANLAGVRSISR